MCSFILKYKSFMQQYLYKQTIKFLSLKLLLLMYRDKKKILEN